MIRFLALLLTPWAIFVSSSLSVYLLNQESLNYNISVLLPFLAAAAVGILVGYGIQYDSEKNRHFPTAPWLFYLAGPGFMLWRTLDAWISVPAAHWLWLAAISLVWMGVSLALKGRRARNAAPFFALFAVLVIVADVFIFFAQVRSGMTPEAKSPPATSQFLAGASIQGEAGSDNLPNIYHVILDGYQSNLFERTLDDQLRKSLRGFRYYPQNTSLYVNTALSVPSIFAGRPWRGDIPLEKFTEEAFSSPASLPAQLERLGYHTTAYLHQEYAFGRDGFDEVFYHHQFATTKPWSDRAFLWAWAYAYWPEPAVRYLFGRAIIERIRAGKLSPAGYSVVSLDAFQQFLKREPALPASGRYTFLHLLLPHPPYVVTGHCLARENVSELEQYRCATRTISRLVAELKRLSRFTGSLIIVHADHGDDLDLDGPWIRALLHDPKDRNFLRIRSRALLLYKPVGDRGVNDLQFEETPTSLLDVAPTVLSDVGGLAPDSFEGFSLDQDVERPRTRYFYVHDGLNLYRWAITNGLWASDPQVVVHGFKAH